MNFNVVNLDNQRKSKKVLLEYTTNFLEDEFNIYHMVRINRSLKLMRHNHTDYGPQW